MLTSLPDFEEALRPLRDPKQNSPDYLASAWHKCLKMVRRNKCTAVC